MSWPAMLLAAAPGARKGGPTLRLETSDRTARRSSTYVKLLTAAPYLILFLFVGFLRHALRTGDLWVRMASGRLVIRDHVIPRSDPFSFTVPGHSWIDHEWVMGAVLYLLNSVNYELVVVVMGLLVLLPFLIIHRYVLHKGAQPLATIGLVAIAMACAWRNYPPRPALLNPLFFAILIIMIDVTRSRRTGHSSWLPAALAIPMMFVWANLQAGFMIGMAVLAAWATVAIVERRNRLVAVGTALGAALAGLINAYGWHLYAYTISSSFGAKPDRLYVQEWLSPDFHSPFNWPFLPAMIVAVYVGLRSMDAFLRILLVGTLCAALISMRFQPFFAVTLIIAIAPQLPATRLPKLPVLRSLAFGSALAIGVLAALFVVSASVITTSNQVPERGLAFLRANYPNEHVLASIGFSNWLVYQNYPVFVDARTTQVYPDQLMRDYFIVDLVRGNWEGVLDKYDINVVMTERDSRLAAALSFQGWNQVFIGQVEQIFVRPGFRVSTGLPP